MDEEDGISHQYQKTGKLGEGTYAVVYKGYHVQNPEDVVAIKKIRIGLFKDGLDMSAIREIKFLQELAHPNVIRVR
jgi:cyclin-dependent kinase 7